MIHFINIECLESPIFVSYEKKYAKTHRFLGLGNHGESITEKSLAKRCFLQAGVDFIPENNKFTIKSLHGKSNFNISQSQRNAINKSRRWNTTDMGYESREWG